MDLNQTTLCVDDFEAAIAFYQRLSLILIVKSDHGYARFEMPDGPATLSIHTGPRPKDASALLYFEVADVDARYKELKANGVIFDSPPEDQSWLWREARFCDPAGNRLCLYHAGKNRRFPPWRVG